MKVLMFGWEFPPHISGGLGTACYGITKSLMEEKTDVLFVVPKAEGDEEFNLLSASNVVMTSPSKNIVRKVKTRKQGKRFKKISIPSTLKAYTVTDLFTEMMSIEHWNYEFTSTVTKTVNVKGGKRYKFTGTYGPSLLDEVKRYGEVARSIAINNSFDVIHAHDWLTYPAGVAAKTISNKPLVVHVHATEYDRAGENNIDPRVFEIEQKGMEQSDRVIAVSQFTKDIIVSRYNISAKKVKVIHNGIVLSDENSFPLIPKIARQVVTFLGRITFQKGPQYFIEAARRVIECYPDAHFIMAGSGDMLPEMIERVAHLRLSAHFHFTGFLKREKIQQVFSVSDVYVMPSVSEPFGITPLEAIHAGVPVIVSNQSGVSEVLDHSIKVDFWDTEALADSIINVLRHKTLSDAMRKNSQMQLQKITWDRAAKKINRMYYELTKLPKA